MEAGGFEPPSRRFCKSFISRQIQLNLFSQSDLKILRIYQDLSLFIRIFSSNAPVLLPRNVTHFSFQSGTPRIVPLFSVNDEIMS